MTPATKYAIKIRVETRFQRGSEFFFAARKMRKMDAQRNAMMHLVATTVNRGKQSYARTRSSDSS